MSKMAMLAYEIEELYVAGMSPKSISVCLEVPMDMVLSCLESFDLVEEA